MTGYESLIDSLKAFIKSDHPEVICLFGAWGTGKTFAWDRALFECGGRENLLYYSYASIFGLNSNEEVKREIIINSSIQGERNIKVPKRLAEKFGPLARAFGGGNAYDAIQEVLFSEIPKGVICIDDIERANSLSIEALMGLAAQLRDQKHCRVCLILNLDNLSSDARQHWDTYQEKSIDRTLAFDPVAPSGSSLLQIDEACDSAIVTHVDRLGIKISE